MTKTKKYEELSPQPVINIGLVGHVDHGKTTLTERLSGKWTDTHSEEIKRGITIRLGYADIIFRECPKCNSPEKYTTKTKCIIHEIETIPIIKVSFVDAPGHESLMASMLSGAAIMDAALLLVAANETCPQPQTREHLMALSMIGIKDIIVVQNKIDLVSEERAIRNYNQIKEFLKGTEYENTPIIPISAQKGVNIDILIQTIIERFKPPQRNKELDPILFVARSFDINKPGITPEKLQGGVLGGAIKQGVLRVGDEIELRPGRIYSEANQLKERAIHTKIIKIMTGGTPVEEAGPGGSLAIQTLLDPSIVKSDAMTGVIVGLKGKVPRVYFELTLEIKLLERVVGADEELKVNPIAPNEILMLNVNSAPTVGIVTKVSKNIIVCKLRRPVCAFSGSRVTISRKIGTRFRLIGLGVMR